MNEHLIDILQQAKIVQLLCRAQQLDTGKLFPAEYCRDCCGCVFKDIRDLTD